ncbi:hypothetical protein CEXT_372651 [Caerostris extrusa]|uniref:Uncharacterized protein n=1 Tax=Caerostris extrusa TaxID=172846 RepID=A0AAV4TVC0_CAEEX|nr:hypothetical protein CEXT_372651 [Caerostris extrusa]
MLPQLGCHDDNTPRKLPSLGGEIQRVIESGRSSQVDLRRKEAEINLDAERELIDKAALSAILGRFQRDAISWERSTRGGNRVSLFIYITYYMRTILSALCALLVFYRNSEEMKILLDYELLIIFYPCYLFN